VPLVNRGRVCELSHERIRQIEEEALRGSSLALAAAVPARR
jgi:DNA-directed RNA polymerase sigma subunit (sigma70/sigma32)